ncbi:hypothetical protein X943_002215 [Babesia divergens]|uniref:Uncharacterized protein n=1 Tax=Babesia divergens TaxID=32595 RepID=A0AAD9GD50_BABDI|nr:hypothetical protein X943_002215 [Babesia divergens]
MNFEVQKDNHLVNSLFLLVNHLVEMPIVINRFASEKILGLLSTWVSAASSFMDALPIQITHMDPACLDCLMLIKMVTAAMNVIKAALSPATLDSNLDLIHAILNCCTLDTLENMLFYLKDPRFDATFEFMKLGAIREHAVTMLDFVSLIVRTFMSFKMHSMYSFTRCKAGFSSRAVFEAVSDLIREINEETVDKKSALALAISGDFNTVVPPTGSARELFHYHMSQLWIAAYGSQHQFTLWSSYTT